MVFDRQLFGELLAGATAGMRPASPTARRRDTRISQKPGASSQKAQSQSRPSRETRNEQRAGQRQWSTQVEPSQPSPHPHPPASRHFHRRHALPGRCRAVRKVDCAQPGIHSPSPSPCSPPSRSWVLPSRRTTTPPIHALTCSERRNSLIQSHFL